MKMKKIYCRLKIKMERILLSAAMRLPKIPISKSILRKNRLKLVPCVRISSNEDSDSLIIAESCTFDVVSPYFVGRSSKVNSGEFRHVQGYLLKDVSVSAYSPALAFTEKLVLPDKVIDSNGRFTTDSGGIFREKRKKYFLNSNYHSSIPCGIHVGGPGAFNWYHFVMELLPKVYMAQWLPREIRDFPLIVPEECQKIPNFSEALNIFSDNRQIVFMKRGDISLVHELVVIDDISFGPYNLISKQWPRVVDYAQHDQLLLGFIKDFREKLIGSCTRLPKSKRIFLARTNLRRTYNQDELIDIAKNFGFEPVFPEELSLNDQAKLYSDSSAIIGGSGAAWVGMIFRESPFVGLSWLPKEYSEFSSYSTLANLLGHDLSFIEAVPNRKLNSTGDAYTSSYNVPPADFDAALQKLFGNAYL